MDFDDLVLLGASLENLKCAICQNYLSYFPIHATDKNENICGRCPPPPNSTRNLAFEALSQSARFPCRWCGTRKMLRDMSEHEEICQFKNIRCPSGHLTSCDWTGAYPDLLQHFHHKHSNRILKNNEFRIDFSRSQLTENFLEYNQMLVILSKQFDATSCVFRWSVHHIKDEVNSRKYSYELILKHGRSTLWKRYQITPFNEIKWNEIALDLIRIRDNESSVIYAKIGIRAEENQIGVKIPLLECTMCFPSLCFPENKILCSNCLNKVEDDHTWVRISCSHKRRGCELTFDKLELMKEHRSVCKFKNKSVEGWYVSSYAIE